LAWEAASAFTHTGVRSVGRSRHLLDQLLDPLDSRLGRLVDLRIGHRPGIPSVDGLFK
jgi:hypothetical protein